MKVSEYCINGWVWCCYYYKGVIVGMFAGFNLKIDLSEMLDKDEYYFLGKSIDEKNKKSIEEDLEAFIIDGEIDGSSLQEEWFPQIKADIFISHSHKDLRLTYCLVGWLYKSFKLKAFVDSNVWGFADDLLRKIDDKYCVNNSSESKFYSYEKRNYSTSHVHMMLSVALNKMIDKTECLFFLNTPESVSITDTVQNTTFSPWIYSELFTSEVIRKQELSRYRKGIMEKKAMFESAELIIRYNISTDHLIDLNKKDLIEWRMTRMITNNVEPLDQLYYLKGIFTITN